MPLDVPTVARALHDARRTRTPIPPPTDADLSLEALDGCAVQQELVKLRLADGDRVVGYKAGRTAKPVRRMLGVDSPDFAPLFATACHGDRAEISAGGFTEPKLAAEIAFVLGTELAGPGVTVADAYRATSGIAAAVEMIDSRIEGPRVELADTVADLASVVAVSGHVVPPAGIDPRLIGMTLTRNGELVDTGAGAAALGDPGAVVAWLANTLGELGATLRPGDLVLTGALHAAVPLAPGDVFRAAFDRLGPITVRVIP